MVGRDLVEQTALSEAGGSSAARFSPVHLQWSSRPVQPEVSRQLLQGGRKLSGRKSGGQIGRQRVRPHRAPPEPGPDVRRQRLEIDLDAQMVGQATHRWGALLSQV